MNCLNSEALNFWQSHRYLIMNHFFSSEEHHLLQQWVSEMAMWPDQVGAYMRYYEPSKHTGEKLLCRIEYFLEYHEGLRQHVIENPRALSILEKLMGEKPVLFKEKINYKMPGAEGFKAHQDAPAFAMFGQDFHMTMMVPIDDFSSSNGGLERATNVVPSEGWLEQNPDGTIASHIEQELDWVELPAKKGDLVFFDSLLPHRSHKNRSKLPRRALYITYNRASDGNVRESYFELKRQQFPQDCERSIDFIPSSQSAFNLGNPIR